jgi:hypothetical protein
MNRPLLDQFFAEERILYAHGFWINSLQKNVSSMPMDC